MHKMFHGFKDSVISEFYLSQVPGVSVMKFPEFEDIPMPYDSKRNKFQAFLLCHGSCEFVFSLEETRQVDLVLDLLDFCNQKFPPLLQEHNRSPQFRWGFAFLEVSNS